MKLKELIKSNAWPSVEMILFSLYPEQEKSKKGYKEVFQKLLQITPTKSNMQIVMEQQFDEETHEESYVHVSGRPVIPEDPSYSGDYAIEYVPWAEWLAMSIHPDTLKAFNELEIIGHCLFEMTFAGFDEETIQQQIADMQKSAEELKNMTEEEKRANTKSVEEFLKELEDDLDES